MDTEPVNEDIGIWCIVANIKREHPFGPGGEETKVGTPQFRGGTKVYIAGCWPGPCTSVVCIGLHRHTRRFITCTVDVKRVENFRVRLVYHPYVRRLIESNPRCWIRTKEHAEEWAAVFPNWQNM